MYDFIFIFFLRLSEKIESDDPKFHARTFIAFTFLFHFILLNGVLESFDLNFLRGKLGGNKYVFLPVAILYIYGVDVIYKKRTDRIIEKYNNKNILSRTNSLLVLSLVFLPLIIGIILLRSKAK